MEINIEEFIQDQCGFWNDIATRDVIRLMRVTSERVFDIRERMYSAS